MSQVSKLNMVNSKLGATMQGQQTTRYIYDTVEPGLGGTFVTFFQTFSGKTEFESNLTTNKLDSSESMVIKSIFLSCRAGGTDDFRLDGHSNLNITVGNQVVLKDFNPSFNATNRGLSYDRLHSGITTGEYIEIRLLTDIVIPPQVNFKATLELAETDAAANTKITLGLKGYGTIFSAGNTF